MNTKRTVLVAFLFGFLCAACALGGQERGKATISGTITDKSGAALAGVNIELKSEHCDCSQCPPHTCDCCPDQHATSNESGGFSFSAGHGVYLLRVKASGFRAFERRVDTETEDTQSMRVVLEGGSEAH
jgi:hypothetical protein